MHILNSSLKKRLCLQVGSWVMLGLTCPIAALAQATPYVPLAPIPGASETGVNLTSYLVGIYKVGIGLASVLAVLVIVWGGFTYISTDAIGGKNEGKEHISNALLGLVLAFSSYLIIYTISPNLVDLSLSLQPVGQALNPGEYTRNESIFYDAQRRANSQQINDIAALGNSCAGLIGSAQTNCLALWQGASQGTSKLIQAQQAVGAIDQINYQDTAAFDQAKAQMNQAYDQAIEQINQTSDDTSVSSKLENQRDVQNWYLDNLRSATVNQVMVGSSVPNSSFTESRVSAMSTQKAEILRHTRLESERLAAEGDTAGQQLLLRQSKVLVDKITGNIDYICGRRSSIQACGRSR